MDRINFKQKICDGIREAVRNVYKELDKDLVRGIELFVPNNRKYGELSSNFCLSVSKKLNRSPKKVAQDIKTELNKVLEYHKLKNYIKQIKVEGGGFLNFYLTDNLKFMWLQNIYNRRYFDSIRKMGRGKKVSIEFVSANPTGPLTIAHARQAVVGDCISKGYEFCGYNVTREYYINDEGRQIDLLGKSVKARCRQLLGLKSHLPLNGYQGQYVINIAKKLLHRLCRKKIKKDIYKEDIYSNGAIRIICKRIKKDLKNLGVKFDKWCKQSSITKSGKIDKLFKELESRGYLYTKNKAVWFKSSAFGDTKDRALIKKNGEYTYFAPDIVYHHDKLSHNHRIINVWGPDHHGYIPRIKAAVKAMGYDVKLVTVLIVQLTTIYSKGKPISMSKRKGEFISLDDILKIVGKDVTRFFLLMRKVDSHLDFDLELAKQSSINNPVYYVQYAHARICSIFKKAIRRFGSNKLDNKLSKITLNDLINLNTDLEKDIISKLIILPDEILICIKNLEPYRIVNYLQELASDFHKYYAKEKVLLKEEKLTLARLYLCECVRRILKQGLDLLGIEAPERM